MGVKLWRCESCPRRSCQAVMSAKLEYIGEGRCDTVGFSATAPRPHAWGRGVTEGFTLMDSYTPLLWSDCGGPSGLGKGRSDVPIHNLPTTALYDFDLSAPGSPDGTVNRRRRFRFGTQPRYSRDPFSCAHRRNRRAFSTSRDFSTPHPYCVCATTSRRCCDDTTL